MSNKKAEIDGWVAVGKSPTRTVPLYCPVCGHKLSKTDCSRTLGQIWVFCIPRSLTNTCRYCAVFEA